MQLLLVCRCFLVAKNNYINRFKKKYILHIFHAKLYQNAHYLKGLLKQPSDKLQHILQAPFVCVSC